MLEDDSEGENGVKRVRHAEGRRGEGTEGERLIMSYNEVAE